MTADISHRVVDLAGIEVPAIEVEGERPGPRLTVIAGVHGCEYSAMAGLRAFVRDLDPTTLAGTLVAVPVLNLPAFWGRTPFVVPADGKNLNRCFPGDPEGTLADQLAYDAFTTLIRGSDALVDMHAGDLVEALEPFALYDAGTAEETAQQMATAYGVGYVIRQEAGEDRTVSGSSSSAAAEIGIPAIIAEAGGCGLVTEAAVTAHRRGLAGVLAVLGMTDPPAQAPPAPTYLERFIWLRCARSGWWSSVVEPGQHVAEGELLGTVSSLDAGTVIEEIVAPADGILMFITTSPAVQDDGLLLGLGASAADRTVSAQAEPVSP